MSVPPFLRLPAGTARRQLPTTGGPLAAVTTHPPAGSVRRGDVLLVPGFTGSKEDFLAVLCDLASGGYRITAPDLRGQLDSDGPDEESAYAVGALARDVVEVLAAMSPPVHLVGHSYGGLVARAAVLADPTLVRSLTLLGSGPAAIPSPAADRLRLMRPILDAGGVPAVWAASQALETADPEYVAPAPEVTAFLHRRYLAMPAGCLGGMARGLLDEPDRVAELAATGVPILVAHGATDDAWPPAVQADMAARLGARYQVIDGAMHSPAAENPAATVVLLLDFWRRAERRTG